MKVLYIAGAGRSGSTLLASVLGQSAGIADVGEIWKHWAKRAAGVAPPCGCGASLESCPFWTAVEVSRPGLFEPTPGRLAGAAHIGYARGAFKLRAQLALGRSGTEDFAAAYEQAYAAVAEVAGARVIVDSSKMPGPGMLVERMGSVEAYVLHLTRDPRAVAASWLVRKEAEGGTQALEPRLPGEVAKAWMARATATELLLRPGAGRGRYRTLAYERFAEEPRAVVDELLTWLGEPAGSPAFTADHEVVLSPTHSSGGNPGRLTRDEQEIRLDDRWRGTLGVQDRRRVERRTTPLRQLYGYR